MMLWETGVFARKSEKTLTERFTSDDDDGAPEQMTMTVGDILNVWRRGAFDFYDRPSNPMLVGEGLIRAESVKSLCNGFPTSDSSQELIVLIVSRERESSWQTFNMDFIDYHCP